MSLQGLHTISLFDNNDSGGAFGGTTPSAGTVVQLNELDSGEGELVVGRPAGDNANSRGEAIYSGNENVLDISVYDDGILSQIEQWETEPHPNNDASGIKIQAVGAGYDKNLQWYAPTNVRILKKNMFAPGNRNMRIVRMDMGTSSNIHFNTNLLAFSGWADTNADNVPDGYNFSGTPVSFINGVFTADYADANAIIIDILFPISGITGTLSVSGEWDDGSTKITMLDFSGGTLTTISTSVQPATGQVITAEGETVSNVFTLNAILFRSNGINTGAKVSFPALTTNGRKTSGTQFMGW